MLEEEEQDSKERMEEKNKERRPDEFPLNTNKA